jgi:hypothetical protein
MSHIYIWRSIYICIWDIETPYIHIYTHTYIYTYTYIWDMESGSRSEACPIYGTWRMGVDVTQVTSQVAQPRWQRA